ncbi:MAG: flagellar hook-associated protein FlgL [bacterium]|nr:flagellar hook-associated protein FlgL [bacterium]
MRVTNSMISNSSRTHITTAKNQMLNAQNQYTTQKKILRPSDDPTVAIRSLQLRTTYSQLNQYVEKNVQDAMSWMDITETAMKNINSILTNMKGYLNQGANDPLEAEDRKAVLAVLKEYANSIFEDEANTDYSGRYVFSGYRTDTSLLFPNDTDNLEYTITENFTTESIRTVKYVSGGAEFGDTKDADDYASEVPKQFPTYRLQLAYNNCSDKAAAQGNPSGDAVTVTLDGTAIDVAVVSSNDADAYDAAAQGTDAIYVYDTGEIIFSEATYEKIQQNHSKIAVQYTKKEFDKSDIRPEMYFECTSYNTTSNKVTTYAEPSDQEISYEINFSQTSVVNTQARDAISTDIYRTIDYIEQTINAVEDIEKRISDVDNMIENTTDETELENYNKLKEMLETEKKLHTDIMTDAFGIGLTMVDKTQNQLNVALADLGSRYNRLELTYDKLLDQRTDTEEKLSNNEDVDIADAYINLTQADNLYQSALSATAKILGNSLLDYI